MRPATARPSWLQTGVMQLGASLRGVVYGSALIVAVPFAWTAGKILPAFFIATVALIGIGVEAVIYNRRDRAVDDKQNPRGPVRAPDL